jgi:N-acetylneuraminate synthase
MTFIIAEIGASHCGSLETARQLVMDAGDAGADAVKLQTFSPDQMAIPGYVIENGPWKGKGLRELYKKTHTPRDWHEELFQLIKDRGMVPISTTFHVDDVEFLESLDCPQYKIASFEATDLDLIKAVASTGKPMYISTGQMSNQELHIVIDFLFGHRRQVTLLHCVSEYPTDMSEANLGRLSYLSKFGPVGLSDHTKGVGAAPLAVALGAKVIEKHIQSCPVLGQDRGFALLPHQFGDMVLACREAEKAIEPWPDIPHSELKRSLWCVTSKAKGEPYTEEDLVSMRPWSGVPVIDRDLWVGREASEDHDAWNAPR